MDEIAEEINEEEYNQCIDYDEDEEPFKSPIEGLNRVMIWQNNHPIVFSKEELETLKIIMQCENYAYPGEILLEKNGNL